MDVSKQRWIVRLERGLRRICWSQLDHFGLLYPVEPQGGQIGFGFVPEEHLWRLQQKHLLMPLLLHV
jgi:hypothetical protein